MDGLQTQQASILQARAYLRHKCNLEHVARRKLADGSALAE